MSKYWQIFWLYRKLRFMRMLEYRQDFIFWAGVSIMWTFFNFFFFAVITNLQGNLGGWTRAEVFVLQGVFTILDAFTWSFFYRNMLLYTQSVFDGSLDLILVKPLDPQYVLTTQDNSYTNVVRLLIGIVTVFYAVSQLPLSISVLTWLSFLLALICGLLMLYAIWFICATGAFWVEKLENINEIIPAMREVYRVPRGVYTGMFSFIFTSLIPFTLITNIPSEILIGKNGWEGLFRIMMLTSFFVIFSRIFFQFSIRRYAGAGS